MTTQPIADDALPHAWEEMRTAMVHADTAALDDLLDEDYVLVHMTGLTQPRADWIDAVATGDMQYHRVDTVRIETEQDASTAIVTVRTRTDATIWGGRGDWRLQLRTTYRHRSAADAGWVATRTVASTW